MSRSYIHRPTTVKSHTYTINFQGMHFRVRASHRLILEIIRSLVAWDDTTTTR